VQGFGGETWTERDNVEDPDIDGKITELIFRKWDSPHQILFG